MNPADFVRGWTTPGRPPLVPQLELHLATEVTPLWQASAEVIAAADAPPPFWAFAWPGGQALARLLLDRPSLAAGCTVLDFAAGCGIAALAAARAGAAAVTAADTDPFAAAAILLNAGRNDLAVAVEDRDLLAGPPPPAELVLAGDVCYEQPMADRALAWLRAAAAAGSTVLLADPGRAHRPATGLNETARYAVPTSRELEAESLRETVVWHLAPG